MQIILFWGIVGFMIIATLLFLIDSKLGDIILYLQMIEPSNDNKCSSESKKE